MRKCFRGRLRFSRPSLIRGLIIPCRFCIDLISDATDREQVWRVTVDTRIPSEWDQPPTPPPSPDWKVSLKVTPD